MQALWRKLESQYKDSREARLYGRLPAFGRTALAFIHEMRSMGVAAVVSHAWQDGQRAPAGAPIPSPAFGAFGQTNGPAMSAGSWGT